MPSDAQRTVTLLLGRVRDGDTGARNELLSVLYRELHALATDKMRGQEKDHTLQATALLHEAYVKLMGDPEAEFSDRNHFMAVATTAMRCILVDHARRKNRLKRRAERVQIDMEEIGEQREHGAIDLVALNEALEKLIEFDPRMARIVELRFFGGFSPGEAAAIIGVSQRTVEREWPAARAWLHAELWGRAG